MKKLVVFLTVLTVFAVSTPPAFASTGMNHMKHMRQQIREKYSAYEHTLAWPVNGEISQKYGKIDMGKNDLGFRHFGLDIAVDQGTEVKAAIDGTVIKVHRGYNARYGYVMIANKKGIATVYGEVSEILVTKNQNVQAGDVIALSGGTPQTDGAGLFSTGPHLHFEVRLDGLSFNPQRYLE